MSEHEQASLVAQIAAQVDADNRNFMHSTVVPHLSEVAAQNSQGGGDQVEQLLLLQAKSAIAAQQQITPSKLSDMEFRVFSQFGEDGILQYLIRQTKIEAAEEVFVEFGVEDYTEANTRFLLLNDHWRGLVMDGDAANMEAVRASDLYWRSDITANHAWIDRDNINDLISDAGFGGRIGILSIDIDGNDYWVWETLEVVDPVIVICEWNGVYGPSHAVSVPYDPSFSRSDAHFSNLYWGASMEAFRHLADKKGYALVGSNGVGNNIFFVKRERLGNVPELTSEQAFREPRFRDSRDEDGNLNFLSGDKRRQCIADLPLIDVKSGKETSLTVLDETRAK
ncbi:MAG: hypothetical protein AAGH82_01780 [Pseudomonadota bacterium]